MFVVNQDIEILFVETELNMIKSYIGNMLLTFVINEQNSIEKVWSIRTNVINSRKQSNLN